VTDDQRGDGDDGYPQVGPPSWSDRATTLRYTLWPTLYVDEHSDTSDLLWQQVLEQRGIRSWLATLTVVLLVVGALLLLVTLIVLVVLAH
jgi:hypothetical protein